MVYSTRRFVVCLSVCHFFLCFSVLLVLRLPRLGKRELILVLFVRLFGSCLFRFVGFLFLLGSGKGCGLWLWHSLDFSLTFCPRKHRSTVFVFYIFKKWGKWKEVDLILNIAIFWDDLLFSAMLCPSLAYPNLPSSTSVYRSKPGYRPGQKGRIGWELR